MNVFILLVMAMVMSMSRIPTCNRVGRIHAMPFDPSKWMTSLIFTLPE